MKSFNLGEASFQPVCEDRSNARDDDIIYKVLRPGGTRECLGYLRFSGKHGAGEVEIVNRNATIEPWHLDLGGTTKEAARNLAGQHGDGLKVALRWKSHRILSRVLLGIAKCHSQFLDSAGEPRSDRTHKQLHLGRNTHRRCGIRNERKLCAC